MEDPLPGPGCQGDNSHQVFPLTPRPGLCKRPLSEDRDTANRGILSRFPLTVVSLGPSVDGIPLVLSGRVCVIPGFEITEGLRRNLLTP